MARNLRTKQAAERSVGKSYGCLGAVLLVSLGLMGVMGVAAWRQAHDPDAIARAGAQRAQRLDAMQRIVNAMPGTAEITSPSRITITVPASTTEQEAKEVALSAYQRAGDDISVHVVTTAGQKLATAP